MFPQIATNYENHERLRERAILAKKNNDVNTINNIIQGQILGKYTTYKSIEYGRNCEFPNLYFLFHWTFQESRNIYCHSKLARP